MAAVQFPEVVLGVPKPAADVPIEEVCFFLIDGDDDIGNDLYVLMFASNQLDQIVSSWAEHLCAEDWPRVLRES